MLSVTGILVIRMRKMERFELCKEMEKDVFFCLVASVGQRKNSECFYAVPLSHKDSMESKAHYEFHIQNMTLATLMIPTVCRRHVIYELCNRPCSLQSLCGSVVEHQCVESESLRFNSSCNLEFFHLSYACDKNKKHLFL